MAVGHLEQQLLEGKDLRLEHQAEEMRDAGMHANAARRLQIHIQVEDALQRVRLIAIQLVRTVVAEIGGGEITRMLVQVADVVDQRIDQLRLDRALHQKPAMLGEMRQLVGVCLIDMPGRRQGAQTLQPIRLVGPQSGQRHVGLEGASHRRSFCVCRSFPGFAECLPSQGRLDSPMSRRTARSAGRGRVAGCWFVC
jgi:hypothetical protein